MEEETAKMWGVRVGGGDGGGVGYEMRQRLGGDWGWGWEGGQDALISKQPKLNVAPGHPVNRYPSGLHATQWA